MSKTTLPSAAAVADVLASVWNMCEWPTAPDREDFEDDAAYDAAEEAYQVECEDEDAIVDVRLQVYPDGSWAVRHGLSDYDQDHKGYWGASIIGPMDTDMLETAEDLIDQCADDMAQRA